VYKGNLVLNLGGTAYNRKNALLRKQSRENKNVQNKTYKHETKGH